MKTIIVTGSNGLIGSETVRNFQDSEYQIVGIDNDMRKKLFGPEASTASVRTELLRECDNYKHKNIDIRNRFNLEQVFRQYSSRIDLIVHTAAQPSHDLAAKEPFIDYEVNTLGTLNLLELTRKYCPESKFVFCSTNKVYGDRPNHLGFKEYLTRYDFERDSAFYPGINEDLSIDQCLHSLFGASKLYADIIVQEYGKYFGILTACFRGGCLTGPSHKGTKLHGFLAYLVKCAIHKIPYRILGYKGKQVRDNIHSFDFIQAIKEYYLDPKERGVVYNIGGGRENSCSILEAIYITEEITGNKMIIEYDKTPRIGDHQWYITDLTKFKRDYPNWKITKDLRTIIKEIYDSNK